VNQKSRPTIIVEAGVEGFGIFSTRQCRNSTSIQCNFQTVEYL
jgi:hypothetical protein